MKRSAVLFLNLLFFVSCSNKDKKGPQEVNNTSTMNVEMSGIYQAILLPVNGKIYPKIRGSFSLVKDHEEFITGVRLSKGPESTLHLQSIHIGNRCPDETDDLNHDGYIDAQEGSLAYKEILIPLDDDLNSQRMGGGIFPASDKYGSYEWSRIASFSKLMNDLNDVDINLTDDQVKLINNPDLDVLNKVVVLRGIPSSDTLPETVSGWSRLSSFESLPIACGIIRKIQKEPGIVDTDNTGIYLSQNTEDDQPREDDGAVFPPTGESEIEDYGVEDFISKRKSMDL
jgi:hypothetical protein